jgi:hypothetical protein
LFDHADLSETNNHTLQVFPYGTLSQYEVGIYNSNGTLQGTPVSLAHMNDQVLSYDQVAAPNMLNISQPGGLVQSVNLNKVNDHRLTIVGNDLTLWNSIDQEMSTITLPEFDCADVMACSAIQTVEANVGYLLSRMDAIETRVTALEDLVS